VGAVHLTHAAFAELVQDGIRAKRLADHWFVLGLTVMKQREGITTVATGSEPLPLRFYNGCVSLHL
jgi:hypothetical protein